MEDAEEIGQQRRKKIKTKYKRQHLHLIAVFCRCKGKERLTLRTPGTQFLNPSICQQSVLSSTKVFIYIFLFKLPNREVPSCQCLTETGLRDLTLQRVPNKSLEGETQGKTVVHNMNINQDIYFVVV